MLCECSDPGCPHMDKYKSNVTLCPARADVTMFRVDMEDLSGTEMCGDCAKDAMETGLFTTKMEHEED